MHQTDHDTGKPPGGTRRSPPSPAEAGPSLSASAAAALPAALLAALLAALILSASGCQRSEPEPKPDQLLAEMIRTYRSADSISIQGTVRQTLAEGENRPDQTADLNVQLVRPSRLRLDLAKVTVACDGNKLRAEVVDTPTADYDGQFLVKPAPKQLTLAELAKDVELGKLIADSLGPAPNLLDVILAEEPLQAILHHPDRMRLLPDKPIDDRVCRRVQVTTERGTFVFWSDRETAVLRRLEFRAADRSTPKEVDDNSTPASLVVDLARTSLDAKIPDATFRLVPPQDAYPVRFFVAPPEPSDDDPRQAALYRRSLEAAGIEGTTRFIELPETKIAPPADPKHLKLTRLWTCAELEERPGNILVLPDEQDGVRILVNDGWRAVAEIDTEGRLVARHRLPLAKVAAVSYLRTVVDGRGRRYFAGAANSGRQVHLFDPDWKLLAEYPDLGQKHDGISDVRLADLLGRGEPQLYVGFWGLVGVHAVTLGGESIWRNRAVPNVFSLSVAPADEVTGRRRLLVASAEGTILPINAFGNLEKAIEVADRAVHRLVAARFPAPRTTGYCVLSFGGEGEITAVALDENLEEIWSYDLPPGSYSSQIQPVTSGRLLGGSGGQWVLAGPDGSIHIISDDGNFFDYYSCGENLRGLAVARLGEKGVLLVSTGKGVTAWEAALPTGP